MTSPTPAPYPLAWPDGVPRTRNKANSRFKSSLAAALANVQGSLKLFGTDSNSQVTGIVLSSNVGGLDRKRPADTGVAAWFTWDGEQRCIAVDRYMEVQDNLQAIHHIIEARRTEMRHGGLHVTRQTFKGFTALPAPKAWRDVLGFAATEPLSVAQVQARHRALAATFHPDKLGGSAEKMAELNMARDRAQQELS